MGATNRLSQWQLLTPVQKAKAVGSNLVEYIKGSKTFEDITDTDPDNKVFRARKAVLGDIVGSSPEFVGAPDNFT